MVRGATAAGPARFRAIRVPGQREERRLPVGRVRFAVDWSILGTCILQMS